MNNLTDLLERHRRFWRCEPVSEPLYGESREGAFFLNAFTDLGVQDGMLALDRVPSPESFVPVYFDKTLDGNPLDGDCFWVLKPPRALPWMEAIIGCGIYVSSSSQAMSAVHPEELPDLAAVDLDSNPWVRLMSDLTDTLATHYGGRFPIGQTLMRGPSDMLSALLGQKFYTDLYEDPKPIIALARQCADIWIRTLKMQYQHIPPYQGGHVSGIATVWAPGEIAVFQEDAGGFISQEMYREFFWEGDTAIAEAFEYSLLHLHSAALQILEPVLEIRQLDAVNVVVDPLGPALPELLPKLQRIQEAGKALHLHGDLTAQELDLVQSALSPNGLCIWIVREKIDANA